MSWEAALAGGAAGCVVTAAATGIVLRVLRDHAILDHPNERSSHERPTPRGGGIAVVSVLVALWLGLWLSSDANTYPALFWLPLVCASLLAAISWWDDIRGLSQWPRLAAQAGAVAAGIVALPDDGLIFQGLLPAVADHALAALAWLWFVNLFNFMDGIDGIAGTEAASVGLGAFLVGLLGASGAEWLGPPGLAATGVALGFLFWNWHPARIFLGDVGSVPLGYLLGWLLLALAASGAWGPALLLPAYYLADATLTLLRRASRGAPILRAHREHFYQRAVQGGLSHARVVLLIGATNGCLIGLALASQLDGPAVWAALGAGGLLVAALLCYLRAANRAA